MRSQSAVAVLRGAGWYPERSVGYDLEPLRADGLLVWPAAQLFAECFAGISFLSGASNDLARGWFDPVKANRLLAAGWVEEHEQRIGSRVIPIGYFDNDTLVLLLAQDGRFFGAFDSFLTHLGNSPLEAIGTLVSGRSSGEYLG